ncbi:MAG: ribonuclease E/G [Pseudomonadota bacterium]
MKGRVIVLDRIKGREAAALVVDGQLVDILIDAPEGYPLAPESIVRGRLGQPMKGQGGFSVDLPSGKGFLRQTKGLTPGRTTLLQVSGCAERGKAPPVTLRRLHKGRTVIVTPGAPGVNLSRAIKDPETRQKLQAAVEACLPAEDGPGIIVRSAAVHAELDDAVEEVRMLLEENARIGADTDGGPELLLDAPGSHHIAWREWSLPVPDDVIEGEGAFDSFDLYSALSDLTQPRIGLKQGAHAFVEPTRALVAVDVNTGADRSLSAGLSANLALAEALPGQLRLRGLGGQIVLDMAPMAKKERRRVEDALRHAVRRDGSDIVLAGWTPLGHFELQRKRDRWPLTELWTQ